MWFVPSLFIYTEFPAETEDAYNFQHYENTAQLLKQADDKETADAADDDEVKFATKKRKASDVNKRDKVCNVYSL